METMKVYIKPWIEALKEAKKHEGFVNFFPDRAEILGVSRHMGDWGHICTVRKISDDEHTSYVIVHSRPKDIGFSYPACCVEEIDSAWLDAHAEIIDEQVVSQTIQYTDDEPFVLGQDYIFIIYKVRDGVKKYFFYAKRISNDMIIGKAEKIIEIK